MMGARAAIYVIRPETETIPHVHLALADLLESADPAIVVTARRDHARVATALSGIETVARLRLVAAERDGSVLSAYWTGLATLRAGGHDGAVILTGSHVFGPLRPGGWRDLASDAALFAPYWHNTTLDL